MKFTNYKQLDKIEFLFPGLMAKDAEAKIRKIFEQLQMSKELLAEANKVSDDLRERIITLEKEWETVLPLIKVTYKAYEKEEIKNRTNIGFKMGTEINKSIF